MLRSYDHIQLGIDLLEFLIGFGGMLHTACHAFLQGHDPGVQLFDEELDLFCSFLCSQALRWGDLLERRLHCVQCLAECAEFDPCAIGEFDRVGFDRRKL